MYCQNMFVELEKKRKFYCFYDCLFCWCYLDLLDQYYSNSVFMCRFSQVDAIVILNLFIRKFGMAFCNRSLHNSLDTLSSSIPLQSESIQRESTNLTYNHVSMHSTRRGGSCLPEGSWLWVLAAPYMQYWNWSCSKWNHSLQILLPFYSYAVYQ